METLIKCIEKIEEIAEPCDYEPCEMNPYTPSFSKQNREMAMKLISELNRHACEYLVDVNGVPNYDNMKLLDYDIFCMEKDKYGWLLGGIVTSKGVIPFG